MATGLSSKLKPQALCDSGYCFAGDGRQFGIHPGTPIDSGCFFGHRQVVFNETANVELDSFADVPSTFIDGLALSVTTRQRGTEDVVSTFLLWFEDYIKSTSHAHLFFCYSSTDYTYCRLVIADCRLWKQKIEIRNSAPMGLSDVSSEFRVSSFEFRISAIDNRKSAILGGL
jgi:hypothetical protein